MNLDLSSYVVFRLSGLLTALALGAVIVLTGGWEAAAAALLFPAGVVWLLSFVTLLAAEERTYA